MKDRNLLLKELTGKDENLGAQAAEYLINSADTELFKMLADKSDFLFPFIRENVCKRIDKAVTKDNFKNIIKFFDYYSPYYDDVFMLALARHADEDLTDGIIELLDKGSEQQKSYAAKYFVYIPDTAALEILSRYVFGSNETLSANCAEALGQMQDDVSFDIALGMLELDDDFEKLKAVRFFISYGRNFPFKEVFSALKSSNMPENIAGQIPYTESLLNLLDSEYKENAVTAVYYIISGLGEILPLSEIFQFELYKTLEMLININKSQNSISAEISAVLLSALSKFKMLLENEEYIFDEDKNTKNEIRAVLKLLENQNEAFWLQQKHYVYELLNKDSRKITAALSLISEFNLTDAAPKLKELLSSDNETVICSILNTLKSLNKLEGIDLKETAYKIKNPNIKALIENMQSI